MNREPANRKRMNRKPIKKLKWFLIILLAVVIAALYILTQTPSLGAGASGKRLARMEASPHYGDGKFKNTLPVKSVDLKTVSETLSDWLFGDQKRVPTSAVPVTEVRPESLKTPPPPGMRAIWLGHASVLIEIDGLRLLTDPVFSEYASPFAIGPKRFHPTPIALTDLPGIDAVVISHDHYDHLDMHATQYLAGKGTQFFVPLGIGAHLEAWKVPEPQIIELDWWGSEKIGPLTLFCTPARHYSGRRLLDTNKTLWCSWSIIGPKSRIFYSGDTGFSDLFQEIGNRLGPFDLTLMKIGSYGSSWLDIHMDPEGATKAHLAVKGRRMLPVHWGTFKLGFHGWKEPVIRVLKAAEDNEVELVTPRVGEIVVAGQRFSSSHWWKGLE